LDYNTSGTITWNTNGINTCNASGGWSGSKAVPTGSESTGNLTASKTYTLTCTGAGGSKADTVIVNVNPAAASNPTLTGRASTFPTDSDGPISIAPGANVILNWSPTKSPTTCTASAVPANAQWSGNKLVTPIPQTQTITNVTVGTVFTLKCTNPSGTGSDSFETRVMDVSLSVLPSSGPVPLNNVTLSANTTGGTSGTYKYFFDCDTSDAITDLTTADVAQSSYAANNLCNYNSPGTKTAKVTVWHNEGSAQTTKPVTVTGVSTIPADPTNLGVSLSSCSEIDLSWRDNSSNESGFKIERKTGSGGSWAEIDRVGADVTAYQNIGLAVNTTYYYRVRAFNGSGDSGYTNEINNTTPVCPTVDIEGRQSPSQGFSDGPITIDFGKNLELKWSSNGATGCSASGGWSGSKATSGTETISNLSQSTIFGLTCTGPTGSGFDSLSTTIHFAPTWKEIIPW
jgi:hypothetical protein